MTDLRDRQWLEELYGGRTRSEAARGRAAVRLEDLAGLMHLNQKMQATRISAEPTAVEYNALLADVEDLKHRLSAVIDTLSERLR